MHLHRCPDMSRRVLTFHQYECIIEKMTHTISPYPYVPLFNLYRFLSLSLSLQLLEPDVPSLS